MNVVLLREDYGERELEANSINVTPNPASQALLVTFERPLEIGCRLTIINQLGVLVFDTFIPSQLLSIFVPIEDVISGVYLLNIHDSNGMGLHQSKLVIIK